MWFCLWCIPISVRNWTWTQTAQPDIDFEPVLATGLKLGISNVRAHSTRSKPTWWTQPSRHMSTFGAIQTDPFDSLITLVRLLLHDYTAGPQQRVTPINTLFFLLCYVITTENSAAHTNSILTSHSKKTKTGRCWSSNQGKIPLFNYIFRRCCVTKTIQMIVPFYHRKEEKLTARLIVNGDLSWWYTGIWHSWSKNVNLMAKRVSDTVRRLITRPPIRWIVLRFLPMNRFGNSVCFLIASSAR